MVLFNSGAVGNEYSLFYAIASQDFGSKIQKYRAPLYEFEVSSYKFKFGIRVGVEDDNSDKFRLISTT